MEFKIIIKKLNNCLSKKEEAIFDKWYNESSKHRDYFTNVKTNYKSDSPTIDIEKAWNSFYKKIETKPKKIAFWKYKVAAVIVLMLSIPFLVNKFNPAPTQPIQTTENIEPGKNKATLTVEDGTQIYLEKGQEYQTQNSISNGEKIVYNQKTSTKKTLVYNYLTVPRGGAFFITLADGSKAWLNSQTKLKYPVNFIKGLPRQVELVYGEAYFEISPSSKHDGAHFKVITNDQEVEVLGTKFNVKAYSDEKWIYTTLVEGKIAILANNNKTLLNPNQQAILGENEMLVKLVDTNTEISWTKGVFSFKDMSLKNIMQVLSRWYDVDVVFLNQKIESELFTGVIGKELAIEEILKIINKVNDIKYEINNNTIILK